MAQVIHHRARIIWSGKNVTAPLSPYFEELAFIDSAEQGAKDELTLTLNNRDGRFYEAWYPETGDKIEAAFIWEENGGGTFPLGSFTIDRPDFNLSPRTVKIRALSYLSIDRDKLKRRINQAWENRTLKEVVESVASQAGYDGYINCPDIRVSRWDIRGETPEQALLRLAKEFGCRFNVKGGRIVFTNKSLTGPALDLADNDLVIGGSLSLSPRRAYASARMEYYDPQKNEVIGWSEEAEDAEGDTVLTVRGIGRSREEARERCRRALKEANRAQADGSLILKGSPISSGTEATLAGVGRLSQAYFIKRAVHTLNNKTGWQVRLTLEAKQDV